MVDDNKRPDVWIGHVRMPTTKMEESHAFMQAIGMRPIFKGETVAVLELRGGTHIVLANDENHEPADVSFDLMVEDLAETHAQYLGRGYQVTEIEKGRIHDSFYLTEPGGNRIVVNSTHVPDHSLV